MRCLWIALLSLALAPVTASADDDDERRKWRDRRAEQYWKHREKAQEEWFKHQEKRLEHERKQWEHQWKERDKYPAQPYGYYRDDRYGHRAAPPPRPWHGEGHRYYAPRRHHDDDDDFKAIYTPWGYYEDYPRVPYDARQPQPRGQGQIGPYRFEIWR